MEPAVGPQHVEEFPELLSLGLVAGTHAGVVSEKDIMSISSAPKENMQNMNNTISKHSTSHDHYSSSLFSQAIPQRAQMTDWFCCH